MYISICGCYIYIYVYIYIRIYISIYLSIYIHSWLRVLTKWSAHMNLLPPMAPYGGQEPYIYIYCYI